MLPKLDRQTLEAFASLEGNFHFERVIDWLTTAHQDLSSAIELQMDEAKLRQTQGACQTLRKIISSAKTARDTIAKYS